MISIVIFVIDVLTWYIFYKLYMEEWKDKAEKRILITFSDYKVLFGHLVFMLLTALILGFILSISSLIDKIIFILTDININTYDTFFIKSGVWSTIIIVIGGFITKKAYNLICSIILKFKPKCIYCISRDSRMWVYIVMSAVYLLLCLDEEALYPICYTASSIIIGKFFWIDNDKNGLKKLLISYIKLPFVVCCIYNMLIKISIIKYISTQILLDFKLCVFILIFNFIIFYFVVIFPVIKKYLKNECEVETVELLVLIIRQLKADNYIVKKDTLKKHRLIKWPFSRIYEMPYIFICDLLISTYQFTAIKEVENSEITTIYLNEINLVGKGNNELEARIEVGKSILEFSIDYYNNFDFSSIEDQKDILPYIFRALRMGNAKKIGIDISVNTIMKS